MLNNKSKKKIENIAFIIVQSEFERNHSSLEGQETLDSFTRERQDEILEESVLLEEFEELLKEVVYRSGLDSSVNYYHADEMGMIDADKYDLIVPCGGDGLFLSAANVFSSSLILGIHSRKSQNLPLRSIGALNELDKNNLEAGLKKIKKGDYFVEEWTRLEAEINRTKISEFALNDILISKKDGSSSYFTIPRNGNKPYKSCSGIIIATGTGSTAHYCNAGGNPFGKTEEKFAYIIQEMNKDRGIKKTNEVISGGTSLIIRPHQGEYRVFFDGVCREHMKEPEEIEIKIARNNPLRTMVFNK